MLIYSATSLEIKVEKFRTQQGESVTQKQDQIYGKCQVKAPDGNSQKVTKLRHLKAKQKS